MDSAADVSRMSLYDQLDGRRNVGPDAHRAVQFLLYAVAAFLVVVTSLYAYT
jgi:hypothetical protein